MLYILYIQCSSGCCLHIHMPGGAPSTLRAQVGPCERYWASPLLQRQPHSMGGLVISSLGNSLFWPLGASAGNRHRRHQHLGLLPPGGPVKAEEWARTCLPACLVWSMWGNFAALTFNSSQRTSSRASSWLSSVGRGHAGPWGTRHTGSPIPRSHLYVIMTSSGCHDGIPAWGPCPRSQSQEVPEVSAVVRAQDTGPGTGYGGSTWEVTLELDLGGLHTHHLEAGRGVFSESRPWLWCSGNSSALTSCRRCWPCRSPHHPSSSQTLKLH